MKEQSHKQEMSAALRGDFARAHTDGDQSDVLPTDTQKNTAFAYAKEVGVSSPEEYAVALAFVVALLDVIPMIGATIGAVIVTAIAFAEDPKIGIACAIFYLIYQQVENYVIYPRVMKRSVDVPGSVTVVAALVGAGLLGVVGALLAIPTAAAILLIMREVVVKRQDQR